MRQLFVERGSFSIKDVCRPLLDDYSVLVGVLHSYMSFDDALANTIRANNAQFFCNLSDKIRKILDLVAHNDGSHAKHIIKERLVGRVVPIGHSCSGVVLAIGKKVKYFSAGDLVACAGDGLANHAEVVCVPEHLVVHVGDEKFLKAASLTGIGALAMQSFRRSDLVLGETVCIIGADVLGQLLVQLANAAGCRVMVLDESEERLDLARRAGAEQGYLLQGSSRQEVVDALSGAHGTDCVIICPHYVRDEEVNLAVDITRKRGRVVLVGNKSVAFKQEHVQNKEVDVLYSLAYGLTRADLLEHTGIGDVYADLRWTVNRNMQSFVHLLKQNRLYTDYLLRHEVRFDRSAETLSKPDDDCKLGFVINYEAEKPADVCSDTLKQPASQAYIPARQDPAGVIKVAFVGAGKIARSQLMPIVYGVKNVAITKIIDRDVSAALNAAKQFRGAVGLSGDPELFYDDQAIDAVYIAADYSLRIEHVINALYRGKAVYLHRPFLFNADEIAQLTGYVGSHAQSRLCFGHYRCAAPFMQKIKKVTQDRSAPLMMQYRLNLGAIHAADTLDRRPRAGNVFEKASHIFEIFYFLTQAQPIAVSVEAVRPVNDAVFPTDNFVVQIGFGDGSVGALQVTSLGNADCGVERMEVHYDGKTIIMDDFARLTGFGLPQSFDELVRVPDKGKSQFIKQFFNAIREPESTKFFDARKMAIVAQLATHVDRLVCQGGGEASLG